MIRLWAVPVTLSWNAVELAGRGRAAVTTNVGCGTLTSGVIENSSMA